MKQYHLRLYPEQPIHLDDATTIPATALRGAIAAVALSTCVPGHMHDLGPCSPQCRYWSLFGEGANLRIGTAYAGMGDDTLPFLATARTCSAVPGFSAAGGHGVFDVAVRQWIFERISDDPSRILAPFSLRCPVCGAALMTCEGLVTQQAEREYSVTEGIAHPVTTRHASLGRVRKQIVDRHEESGFLLNRGVHYIARIDVPERLDGLFREVIGGGLWIGGRRSRGMGAMRIELAARSPDELTLDERIARFNRFVRGEYRYYTAMGTAIPSMEDGEWYFTLDLRSPAAAAYEAAPTIAPLLHSLPSVNVVRQWISIRSIGGWNAGMLRRTQPGAVGVILYRVPAETRRAPVEEALAFLESSDADATICDPFHLIADPL